MSRPDLFLSLPLDAWTCFISIQNAIFCQHVIPSETLTNESVTSIIHRYSTILSLEILLWVLQPSSWDNKVKIAEFYFDMIGPEKPTRNLAQKLLVATVVSLCFRILIPLIQGVIQFKNSQLCTVLINWYLAFKIMLPACTFWVYQVSSLNPHPSFWA